MIQAMGIEPMRISPAELKSASLTTRTNLLEASNKTFSKVLRQLTMITWLRTSLIAGMEACFSND